ncbi:pyridoxal phosphate-dependent decarboxylase family protein [Paraliomyxa miuraensis]|uniref:pyridoxal phosphate-dependent decarboxylase family protein n=1 Tax=Paraliomyxa miuraensis TaxID=376150 RepID=UPI00225AF9DC|nr:aspartate aminotransferase family protein [Paraliomyxa miuraensis]MCX4245116.1 aspartate aminotransferase family protein [Paraliomyxa miuraensis]
MDAAAVEDARWRDGKTMSLVFDPGEEIAAFTKQAYTRFFSENALNPSAFPSLRRFENEVVAMTAQLLGGDRRVVGTMTSGGSESILLAVKAARDWAAAERRVRGVPQIVLPRSAHPAFPKACSYFGLEPVFVPVREDFRADPLAMRRTITSRTILVVGSAPAYPQGVVDPIDEIADLARRNGLWCHVDACVGGFMLPFVRELGWPVPPFDFSVPGVVSMSADLHKYGYSAKGASVVLFRDARRRRYSFYAFTDWPGGIYASSTMTGTRPGGAIAAAWAVMQHLGRDGYRSITREVMDATQEIRRGVAEIEGVEVLGEPHMSVLALGSRSLDIYAVGDELTARGWHIDRQQRPASLHLTVQRGHVGRTQAFLTDLRAAVGAVGHEPGRRWLERSALAVTGAALRMLPGRVTRALTLGAASRMGIGEGGSLPARSAPMYGMMASLPNRGDLKELVLDALDRMTRLDDT